MPIELLIDKSLFAYIIGIVGSTKNPNEEPDQGEMKLVERYITQENLEGRKSLGPVQELQDMSRVAELQGAGRWDEAKQILGKWEREDKMRARRYAMKYLDVADLEELLQLKKAGKTEYEAQ